MKRYRTEAQRAASRRNGAKSRGPVTERGKLMSSQNALNHGLMARSILLPTESRARFAQVCQELESEYHPQTPTEKILLHHMIAAQWRLIRLWNYERVGLLQESSLVTVPEIERKGGIWKEPCARDTAAFRALHGSSRSGSVIQISEMRYQRQFSQAVSQFRLSQALRPRTRENEKPENEPEKSPS